jgi:hypothetical protein
MVVAKCRVQAQFDDFRRWFNFASDKDELFVTKVFPAVVKWSKKRKLTQYHAKFDSISNTYKENLGVWMPP